MKNGEHAHPDHGKACSCAGCRVEAQEQQQENARNHRAAVNENLKARADSIDPDDWKNRRQSRQVVEFILDLVHHHLVRPFPKTL